MCRSCARDRIRPNLCIQRNLQLRRVGARASFGVPKCHDLVCVAVARPDINPVNEGGIGVAGVGEPAQSALVIEFAKDEDRTARNLVAGYGLGVLDRASQSSETPSSTSFAVRLEGANSLASMGLPAWAWTSRRLPTPWEFLALTQ